MLDRRDALHPPSCGHGDCYPDPRHPDKHHRKPKPLHNVDDCGHGDCHPDPRHPDKHHGKPKPPHNVDETDGVTSADREEDVLDRRNKIIAPSCGHGDCYPPPGHASKQDPNPKPKPQHKVEPTRWDATRWNSPVLPGLLPWKSPVLPGHAQPMPRPPPCGMGDHCENVGHDYEPWWPEVYGPDALDLTTHGIDRSGDKAKRESEEESEDRSKDDPEDGSNKKHKMECRHRCFESCGNRNGSWGSKFKCRIRCRNYCRHCSKGSWKCVWARRAAVF